MIYRVLNRRGNHAQFRRFSCAIWAEYALTSILSPRQLKKAQNINPVVTATGKMPKHQSCRHGNRKIPKESILLSRHPLSILSPQLYPFFGQQHGYYLPYPFRQRKRTLTWSVLNWNPATTYPPGPFPAKYFRR